MEVFKIVGKIAVDTSEANKAVKASVDNAEEAESKMTSAFKKIGAAAVEAFEEDKIKDFGDSCKETADEVQESNAQINKSFGQYSDSVTETKKRVKETNKEIGKTADDTEKAGDRMTSAFKKIGAAVVTAFAVDKIKDFGISCMETAAEIQASNSQFAQTFGEYADSATEAIGRVADASGIIDTRLQKTATSIYAFAKSSGAETEEAMQLMETSLNATADAAAYYDRSLEDTAETLQSFLKGNYENDSALGVSCTEFTRNAAAAELFGEKFNDLTEIQKQQTLLKMVTDSQKLSGAMGQAAREADGWENVLGNIKETLRQLKGKVGAPILKNVIPAVKKLTDAIDKNADKFANGLVPVIDTIIGDALPALVDLLVFAVENFDALATTIGISVAAFKTMQIISTVSTAIQGATTAMGALNAVMMANPIGLVVGALGALSVALIGLSSNREKELTEEEKITEAIKEENKKREENINKIEEQKAAIDAKAQSELVEVANTERLWNELKRLCDEQGNVAESDKARAEFILSELNKALGTEYTMTGNQITQYSKLKDSVDAAIKSKKAEIMLAAEEEKYKLAINNLSKTENELAEQKQKLDAADLKLTEAKIKWEDAQAKGRVYGYEQQYDAAETYYNECLRQYNEQQAGYETLKNSIQGYCNDISSYEQASALVLQGCTDEAIRLLDEQGMAYKKASDLAGESADKQKQVLYDQLMTAQNVVDNTKELMKTASEDEKIVLQERLQLQEEHLRKCREEWEKAGGESTKKFISGSKSQQGPLNDTISTIMNGAVNTSKEFYDDFLEVGKYSILGIEKGWKAEQLKVDKTAADSMFSIMGSAKRAADIHSPSRLFAREVGKWIPAGIGKGIKDNEDEAVKPVENVIDKMAASGKEQSETVVNNINQNYSNTYRNEYVPDIPQSDAPGIIERLDRLIEVITGLKIYINSDVLVGEIAPEMNSALGDLSFATERGI